MRLTQRAQTLPAITLAELDAALAEPSRDRSYDEPATIDLDTLMGKAGTGGATQAEFDQLAGWAAWLERECLDQSHELRRLRERCAMLGC